MYRLLSTYKFSTKSQNVIDITNNAWIKIIDILDNNKYGMIFSATTGGCNGFNYNLQVLDEDNYKKIITYRVKPSIIKNRRFNVYIDPLSEMFLLGTTIDYQNENYSKGIYESKFIFIPNKDKATSCGCGISFTPKI